MSTTVENLGRGTVAYVNGRFPLQTDAVLLAAFSAPKPEERCCDLGTGSGVIPLIWLRDGVQQVSAVEIQPEGCSLLQRSARESGVEERLEVVNADLKTWRPDKPFSLVTMNPPYFRPGAGGDSPVPERRWARSQVLCTLEQGVQAAARLLLHHGRFCVCYRPENLCDLLEAMRAAGVEPKRLRFVKSAPDRTPSLVLAQGKKGAKPSLHIEPDLICSSAQWQSIFTIQE